MELQGGKPWPGIGFAMGQERLVELLGKEATAAPPPHAYLVMMGPGGTEAGLALAERLRGVLPALRLESNLGGGNFKSQFRRADRSGAALALILGDEELERKTVSLKPLREEGGAQHSVALTELETWLREWLQRACTPAAAPPMF